MVPADDQAMVLPCASVMVMVVLLNDEFTCATPDAMFLRSRRRTRAASLPIPKPFLRSQRRRNASGYTKKASSEWRIANSWVWPLLAIRYSLFASLFLLAGNRL